MSTINNIIEATRAKFCPSIYHNYGGLNVLADELAVVQDTSNIFALFVQSTSSTPVVEGRSVSEEYTLSVAFCKLMPSDSYDAEQVESEYITPCKNMAQTWLSWLIANYPRLRILATNANREYLRYDAILCGYSLTMQIKEYSVNYTCLIKPTPVPQYERILKKMPQNLRSALLVWYCPKLQGLTNEQLAENSGYYKGGLHDLSGNGYDADIYGMSGQDGDGYVNEQGELVFDGVDDYVTLNESPICLNGYDVFVDINGDKLLSPIAWEQYAVITTPNSTQIYVIAGGTQIVFRLTNTTIEDFKTFEIRNNGTDYAIFFNGIREGGSTNSFTPSRQVFRLMARPSQERYCSGIMRMCIIFNTMLSDEERTWLRFNMINI